MQSRIKIMLADMAKNAETLKKLNGGIQTIVDEEILEILDNVIKKEGYLPNEFKKLYRELKEQINHRQTFIDSKIDWCNHYPDFKRISDVMDKFKSNQLLREFCSGYPLKSNEDKVIEIYKKCISFRTKFTKKTIKNLKFHPNTNPILYSRVKYCIEPSKVKEFLNTYQSWLWNESPVKFWGSVYNLRQDFIYDSGYDKTSWENRIASPDLLKSKADEVEKLQENVLTLLHKELELIIELDRFITYEYSNYPLEMSIYEMEKATPIQQSLW